MIEISFAKLILLALVALVVLGPEKLPGAARTAGALLRRVRSGWDSVRSEVERELEVEEIRRAAHEAMTRAEAAQAEFRATATEIEQTAAQVRDEVQAAVSSPAETTDQTTAPASPVTAPGAPGTPAALTATPATLATLAQPAAAPGSPGNIEAAAPRAWPTATAAEPVAADAGSAVNAADADALPTADEPDPQQELPLAMPAAVNEVRHGRH